MISAYHHKSQFMVIYIEPGGKGQIWSSWKILQLLSSIIISWLGRRKCCLKLLKYLKYKMFCLKERDNVSKGYIAKFEYLFWLYRWRSVSERRRSDKGVRVVNICVSLFEEKLRKPWPVFANFKVVLTINFLRSCFFSSKVLDQTQPPFEGDYFFYSKKKLPK